jgi:hypothetical protein
MSKLSLPVTFKSGRGDVLPESRGEIASFISKEIIFAHASHPTFVEWLVSRRIIRRLSLSKIELSLLKPELKTTEVCKILDNAVKLSTKTRGNAARRVLDVAFRSTRVPV